MRADGLKSEDFFDLVREMRNKMVRDQGTAILPAFTGSSARALAALFIWTHRRDDPDTSQPLAGWAVR